MGINITRHPEYGVTLLTFSGKLGIGDFVELCDKLDQRDRGRWLSYCDSTLDTTGIDVAHIPELKRVVALKQSEIFPERPPPNAIVYSSAAGEAFTRFWQKYTLAGNFHPMTPTVFSDFNAACNWLGLPQGACRKFEAEVESQSSTRPADSQPPGNRPVHEGRVGG